MHIPILRLPYTDDDIRYITDGIVETLKSGYLTMGPKVKQFEDRFAEFAGSKYAVGVNSGTSALEIILRSIGVEGKTVVVPTITFMATALAVIHAGGRVIFADVRSEDCSIDPDDLQSKLRKDTAAAIVVHIGGVVSGRYGDVAQICKENGVALIEDAAHAHGSMWRDKPVGTLGVAAAFSFYPTKVLTTAEGGMITTDSEQIHKDALTLREHGKPDHRFNVHTEIGYNWRFSEIHAVLGLQQMSKASAIVEERRRIAGSYDRLLTNIPQIMPLKVPEDTKSSFYKYIAYLDQGINRDRLKELLKRKYDIAFPGEVYSDPCHSQPLFGKYPDALVNDRSERFPGAEYVCSRQICLPLYPGLRNDEIDYVVASLQSVLND